MNMIRPHNVRNEAESLVYVQWTDEDETQRQRVFNFARPSERDELIRFTSWALKSRVTFRVSWRSLLDS